MRKVVTFSLYALLCIGVADAAVRDANSPTRATTNTVQTSTISRAATSPKTGATTSRSATATPRDTTSRESTVSRAAVATGTMTATPRDTSATSSRAHAGSTTTAARSAINARSGTTSTPKTTVARAAIDETTAAMSETRTGAEYERCKTAYFTCMDQFCAVKNDNYRRCSCSDRVYDFEDVQATLQDANDRLTEFTENLDIVGMTSAQATAMRTASEGELALTSDGSASKALLQAIMNSIRGEDSTVGGKYSDLNSINISFDTSNAFGMQDAGQAIAAYNGKNLYTAIYSQCRSAVRADCNDASLQRAVTAYLMAVEQDCNSVQTAINENKKKMTAAVREGNAMLDLARVENRQQHNAYDMTTCLANVEAAVKSEEVCGKNYHKCLDNGEFIDVSTGAPIAGVVRFYELESILTFNDSLALADQKLSKVSNNRTFVQNFEKRVKKFAEPALDKCTEKADEVWADYLDKAMLDIYYAQRAKVAEIKQGCFDFVSACYVNANTAVTAAMMELTGTSSVIVQPDKITLNSSVCTEYVASCDNMFDGNIVQQYIDNVQDTDTLTACRAVVKQCFDSYGGASYENFYYPYSGLFTEGNAADWFTLYDQDGKYKSECAKQLAKISSCNDKDMMERAFGGFDYVCNMDTSNPPNQILTECDWGQLKDATITQPGYSKVVDKRALRPSGVATEVYYQVIDVLSTQCTNVQGRFTELQFLKQDMYDPNDVCKSNFVTTNVCNAGQCSNNPSKSCTVNCDCGGEYCELADLYGVGNGEDMCPRGYRLSVDTKSWGACLCWENGARRSKWGTSVKCVSELPVTTAVNSASCSTSTHTLATSTNTTPDENWCTQGRLSYTNQVCPFPTTTINGATGWCVWDNGTSANYNSNVSRIPKGII